ESADGEEKPLTMTVTFGETYDGLPELSNPWAVFEGWFTSRTGGQQVTAETKVTHLGDHVLYAHWLPVGGPAPDPETEGETEAAPAEQQTEPEAEPEQQPEEDGIRLVPIVCIAVSVLAIAAAAVVLLKHRDRDE
ncbi:MAG: InlB B-repeat-containing protein, partial [Clostridia bacterium]|nr:InlB B-repeat-containing protein [Clostridia bacterium]